MNVVERTYQSYRPLTPGMLVVQERREAELVIATTVATVLAHKLAERRKEELAEQARRRERREAWKAWYRARGKYPAIL